MAEMETRNVNELLQIRRDKLAELQEAGKDPFVITKYDVTHHSSDIREKYDELEGKEVCIAGRMMSKRVMGKASFCHIQDLKGTIQCYVARDFVGEESYKDFKKMDIGDIIGLKGTVLSSPRRPARSPSMRPSWSSCPRVCRSCPRSITA